MPEMILIVDSDQKFVDELKPKLEAAKFEVNAAINGPEGSEMLKAIATDFAIIDMTQEASGGMALVAEMQTSQTTNKIPILALTSPALVEQTIGLPGITDFLVKPIVDVQDVIVRIRWNLSKFKEHVALLETAQAAQKPPEKKRILIVDDNEDIVATISAKLELEGYVAAIARNGEEAISEVSRQQPDLVLLDVMMPKVDGFSTMKQINQITGRKVPIVVITGAAAVPEEEFRIEGACAFLRKPVDISTLIGQIKVVIG